MEITPVSKNEWWLIELCAVPHVCAYDKLKAAGKFVCIGRACCVVLTARVVERTDTKLTVVHAERAVASGIRSDSDLVRSQSMLTVIT